MFTAWTSNTYRFFFNFIKRSQNYIESGYIKKQFVLNQGEDTEDWTDNDVTAEEEGVANTFQLKQKNIVLDQSQGYFDNFSSGGQ